MWKILTQLKKNLVWSIPILMIAGIIVGSLINPAPLKQAILPLTFLMVYPMMVNLQIDKVFSREDAGVLGVAQLLNFGVIPFVAFGLGLLFFPGQPTVQMGLLLVALLPTSGMTISWTGFAKGNINAAIKMTVIGLLLGSLATPLFANWLLGEAITLPLFDIFRSIVQIVFIPMVLGYLTRRLLVWRFGAVTYKRDWKGKFPLLSTLGVLGIVFVAMALKAKSILADPAALLLYFVPVLLFYVITFGISTVIGRLFFNRGDAIALVFGTAMRNLSIALALAMTVFGAAGSDIAIVIAVGFIVQVQFGVWTMKLTEQIFGVAPQPIASSDGLKGQVHCTFFGALHFCG